MDIASAHLALTYMERYITDTDKIGMEWQVWDICSFCPFCTTQFFLTHLSIFQRLCLYEAEMKQAEVGGRSENADKNRFSTVLPCKLRNIVSVGRSVSLVENGARNRPRVCFTSLDRVNTCNSV